MDGWIIIYTLGEQGHQEHINQLVVGVLLYIIDCVGCGEGLVEGAALEYRNSWI